MEIMIHFAALWIPIIANVNLCPTHIHTHFWKTEQTPNTTQSIVNKAVYLLKVY